MTDLDEGAVRLGGDSTQWADYGVNVGHNVYGGIHVHPPFPSAGPPPPRPGAARPRAKRRPPALPPGGPAPAAAGGGEPALEETPRGSALGADRPRGRLRGSRCGAVAHRPHGAGEEK